MKNKKALFLVAALFGGTVFSSCLTFKDFRKSFFSGTLDFVSAYTFNTWNAIVPGVDDFLND